MKKCIENLAIEVFFFVAITISYLLFWRREDSNDID